MFLLLANDDGYLAPGLRLLADALRPYVSRLAVMAPDRNRSAASHCLTLTRPLTITEHGDDIYSVDGTPSDCVHLALTGYFEQLPDMIISGINSGPNLGGDVMYSGTVAAAYAGLRLPLPVLAVSNVSHQPQYFADSVKVVRDLFLRLQKHPLPQSTFLNVNIPDLPYDKIKGIQTTVLGSRGASKNLVPVDNPRGGEVYWLGRFGDVVNGKEGTDFYAVAQGYVSLTPLQFDLTNFAELEAIRAWSEEK